MLYPVDPPQPTPGKKQAAALVVLNPAQSRRLVAKGAVARSKGHHRDRGLRDSLWR